MNEQERQAFQNWWRTQRKACQFSRIGGANGKYHSKPVQKAWEAWQARAALPAVNLADLVPGDTKRMDWLVSKVVNVREPLPYGSHNILWSQQTTDDCDENYATDLREQIDAEMLRRIEAASGAA